MLLIAQPRSASTSLAKTIAEIGKLNVNLGIPRNEFDIDCEGYIEIQKYHSNMVERNMKFLSQEIKGRKTLFKEHLLPTNRHLKILNKIGRIPYIVLLRDPDESLDSYIRLFKKNKDYDKDKLLNDLRDFHDRYMWWASNKPNVLIFYYRDLILNYNTVIRKILKHYKIKYNKIIRLKKLHYTGIGEKRVTNSPA
jgi:hypothetical protein